jgi:aspartyl-tRNA(Asn)/glutamyl-tRNA(Gln) amidotransferase subunit C
VKIDNDLLSKLEKLSLLNIQESKKEQIKSQLSNILTYIDSLNELDTSNVEAYFSTLDGGTPLREDSIRHNSNIPQDILKHAPQTEDDFFVVPAIIE